MVIRISFAQSIKIPAVNELIWQPSIIDYSGSSVYMPLVGREAPRGEGLHPRRSAFAHARASRLCIWRPFAGLEVSGYATKKAVVGEVAPVPTLLCLPNTSRLKFCRQVAA